MDSLTDKVAIITGAASGIGRASACAMASRSARVIVADIDGDGADAVTAEIEGAGLPQHLPVQEWQRIIDLNLMSVVRSNAAFLPLLIGQGHGHIVNTASLAGLFSYSYDRLPYAAAKAAVVQMSEGLRLYLHPLGIGVTVLCPGPVATNIITSLPPTFGPEVPTRGPGEQFEVLMPEVVGEQVAEAIINDTFMVYTHADVRDILVERASDWNAFIARRTDEVAGHTK